MGREFKWSIDLNSCCTRDISALVVSNLFGHFSLIVESRARICKNFPGTGKPLPKFPLISLPTQGSQQPSNACGEEPHHLEGDTTNTNKSFHHPSPEGKHADVITQAGNVTAMVLPGQGAWFRDPFPS